MNKVLTIIIPTYNMEKYLRHCLDSLIVPNMDKVEVLVINDGSKDSSSAIAHEYQDKYPNTFRVIDKENGNYGSCINRGLKEACGKYIKILDADDSFDNENFNLYIDKLCNIDVDLILTDYIQVDGKDNVTGKTFYSERIGIQSYKALNFDELVRNGLPWFLFMHAITYRKSIFDGLDYQQREGISYTDSQWALEPMVNVETIYYIPLVIYRYLLGRDGQTMMNESAKIQDIMEVTLQIINFYYCKNVNVTDKDKIFQSQIKLQLWGIYSKGLYYQSYNIDKLKHFESKLKTYPYYYEMAQKLKCSRVPIVKIWKKYGLVLLKCYLFVFKKLLIIEHPLHACINKLIIRRK